MSFLNVGRVWSPTTLAEYLKQVKPPVWATSVTIHHTAAPSLAQRPDGLTAQHIRNIQSYYQKTLGWSRGPHFFIDEDQVWGMTPPTVKGIHAKSFNESSIGIEVLGNYDSESPVSGRGSLCWDTAASATLVLLNWLGIAPNARTVLFHRDDPKTSKSCPGNKVTKDFFLALVEQHKLPQTVEQKEPESKRAEAVIDLVEIVRFVSEKMSKPYSEVAKALVRKDKQFTIYGKWLETAFYDKVRQATVASKEEIEEVLAQL